MYMQTQTGTGVDAGSATFYVGVDTHKDTHTFGVLDTVGREVFTHTFPADLSGYHQMIGRLQGLEGRVVIGVEGTNSYGVGLTIELVKAGFEVYEVLRPGRSVGRRNGKSDPIDALAAARTVMSGQGLSVPKTMGPAQSLRYLHTLRAKYVVHVGALTNMMLSFLVTAPVCIRQRYQGMPVKELLARLGRARPSAFPPATLEREVMTVLKNLAQTGLFLHKQADTLEEQMDKILQTDFPAMLDVYGCGTITAAQLVVAAGDNPKRIRNQKALAKMFGACPLPASSGRTDRHRLNRTGNRQANKALHQIILVRMSHDPKTRHYIQRRTKNGATKKEAMRCLKRALCREIYRALTNPQHTTQTPTGPQLAALRKTKKITQAQAAKALNTHPARISDIETGNRPNPELKNTYTQWLTNA